MEWRVNRMDALSAKRRETRQERASAAVARILRDAESNGTEITIIGSLAKGDFRSHSDVDLLVRGPIDLKRRRWWQLLPHLRTFVDAAAPRRRSEPGVLTLLTPNETKEAGEL